MENWVITDCGKLIDIDGENGLNWNYMINDYKSRDRISRFGLKKDKFNRKHPTIESVDNAIAEQYPTMVLENGKYADWYVLNNIEYSPNRININTEEFKLNIPNSSWSKISVNKSLINTVDYEELLTDLKYYNKNKVVRPLTNDLYVIAFYDIWCVLYRFKKVSGVVKTEACLLRNNYSNCKNIKAMTYAKNIIQKEFIFSNINPKNNNSLVSAIMKVKNGWLETGHLFKINNKKMVNKERYNKKRFA